ncbi:hypothetical protein [Sanguibacter massiliensis]|uniref:hypothetical protein n=1 Tax=Sanguibacter massiliensis TaxID=1973217 RepID=UPI00101AE064|nr:hypothetical protein [Sanguibacter massiliensis]
MNSRLIAACTVGLGASVAMTIGSSLEASRAIMVSLATILVVAGIVAIVEIRRQRRSPDDRP